MTFTGRLYHFYTLYPITFFACPLCHHFCGLCSWFNFFNYDSFSFCFPPILSSNIAQYCHQTSHNIVIKHPPILSSNSLVSFPFFLLCEYSSLALINQNRKGPLIKFLYFCMWIIQVYFIVICLLWVPNSTSTHIKHSYAVFSTFKWLFSMCQSPFIFLSCFPLSGGSGTQWRGVRQEKKQTVNREHTV